MTKSNSVFRFVPEIILLVFVVLFALLKNPSKDWDRVINSDGKAYYAYLPAIFIYDDLNYEFVEYYEQKYYPPDRSAFKKFRMTYRGDIVNKAFAGIALLWLPFFLIAHLFAVWSIFPADGYSLPYQLAIGFATLFYFYVGLKILFQLLKKLGASQKTTSAVLFIIAIGTNMIYYALIESSMAHIANFFLINGFLLSAYSVINNYRRKYAVLMALVFSLIVIIRPVNALVVLLIPFLAGSPEKLTESLQNLIRDPKTIFFGLITAIPIFVIPIVLWYLQTGYFFVYSYGEESFDFTSFHFFDILFSYDRGWLVYTPVAALSLAGLYPLFKQNRFRFFTLLGFLLIIIYLFSSWWVWNYASKFGQRVFIDYYALIAIMLVFLFMKIKKHPTLKVFVYGLTSVLIILNIVQFFQHRYWIFPKEKITKEIYWQAFTSFVPRAMVRIDREKIVNKKTSEKSILPTSLPGIETPIDTTLLHDSIMHFSAANKYSRDIIINYPAFAKTTNIVVQANADIYAESRNTGSAMVIEFSSAGQVYSFNPFYLDKYIKKGGWRKMEFAVYAPKSFSSKDMVRAYFYNFDTSKMILATNFQLSVLSIKKDDQKEISVRLPIVYPSIKKTVFNNMEATIGEMADPWVNTGTISDEKSFSGRNSSLIQKGQEYSIGFNDTLRKYLQSKTGLIRVAAMLLTDTTTPSSRMVIEVHDEKKLTHYRDFYFSKNLQPGQWTKVDFVMAVDSLNHRSNAKVYFWNPNQTETLFIDDFQIDFISIKQDQSDLLATNKPEGVIK